MCIVIYEEDQEFYGLFTRIWSFGTFRRDHTVFYRPELQSSRPKLISNRHTGTRFQTPLN